MNRLLVCAVGLCLSAQIGFPQGNKHKMSISGTVTGASATLTLSGTLSGTQTTDGFGNYTFPNLQNGSYVVAPSHSGYTFSPSTRSVSIAGNTSATGVNFTATAITPPPNPPVINSFTASPSTIASGDSSTISWNVTGGTTCSINNSVGTVTCASGSAVVTPSVTTVYVLTANNSAGTVTRNGTITVNTTDANKQIGYWKLDDASGGTAADSSGNAHTMTLANSPSWQTTCVLNGCLGVNGTTQSGSVALDLSTTAVVTLDFWMKWNAFANDDHIAFEFTPNFGLVTTGFIVLPNDSTSGQFQVAMNGNSGFNTAIFPRPSAGVWHNYAFVLNKGAAAASQVIPYVDGVAVSYSKQYSSANSGNFGNSTLYAMARAGTSLFAGGWLDEVYVYGRALSASEISTLAATAPPVQHSVALTWTSSTSAVSGYRVKRATVSGGPYVQLNSGLISGLGYTDATVNSGQTYYYVATAVDGTGLESVNSNQATSGVIP